MKEPHQTSSDVEAAGGLDTGPRVATGGRLVHPVLRPEQDGVSSSPGGPSRFGGAWGVLMLAGGAYAVYRANHGVRDRVDDLLQRFSGGVQDAWSRTRGGGAGVSPRGVLGRFGVKASDEVRHHLRLRALEVQRVTLEAPEPTRDPE